MAAATGGSGNSSLCDGEGADTINDFADGFDLIALSDFGLVNAADANSNAVNQNGDVVFDFGGGDQLIVEDILKSDLSGPPPLS